MILAANQMQICIWSPPIAMITCLLSQISVWVAKSSHFKSRSVKRGLKAARVCQQVRRGTCLMACQSGLLACPLGKSGKFCDRSLRSKLGPANRDFFGQITHLVAFLEGRSLNNVTLYCVGNQSFGHLAIQFRGIRSKLIYKLNCFTFDKLTHLFKVKLISLVGKKGLQNGLLNLRERFKGIYLIRILFYKEGLYKINIDTRVSFYRNCSLFTGPRCLWGPVYGSRCL